MITMPYIFKFDKKILWFTCRYLMITPHDCRREVSQYINVPVRKVRTRCRRSREVSLSRWTRGYASMVTLRIHTAHARWWHGVIKLHHLHLVAKYKPLALFQFNFCFHFLDATSLLLLIIFSWFLTNQTGLLVPFYNFHIHNLTPHYLSLKM